MILIIHTLEVTHDIGKKKKAGVFCICLHVNSLKNHNKNNFFPDNDLRSKQVENNQMNNTK